MKKFIFAFLSLLGFVIKMILLFSAAVIGMDMLNRYLDEKAAAEE